MKKLFQKLLAKLVKKAINKSVNDAVSNPDAPPADPHQHPHGHPDRPGCHQLHGTPLISLFIGGSGESSFRATSRNLLQSYKIPLL